MDMILIIGSITFLEKGVDKIAENMNVERLAIVHSINTTVECSDSEQAGELGEEAITMGFDSYLIPEDYNGHIQYECEEEGVSPIDVDSFKKDYLN